MEGAPVPAGEEPQPRLTRGAVVAAGLGAVGVVAGVGALAATSANAAGLPFSPGFADTVHGNLRRIVSESEIELTTPSGVEPVSFAENTLFWREGPSEIHAFLPGEEIIVEGTITGGRMLGYAMINMYRGIEARVLARSGSNLRTDQGGVRLIGSSRFQNQGTVAVVPDAAIAPGEDVVALGRLDADGGFIALRLYPHEHKTA